MPVSRGSASGSVRNEPLTICCHANLLVQEGDPVSGLALEDFPVDDLQIHLLVGTFAAILRAIRPRIILILIFATRDLARVIHPFLDL